jgi:hypothetical protein
MELAPFHAALRADDVVAAVREAAALLGVETPAPAAVTPVAEAVDDLVARHRPALAGGHWIEEWRADRVIADADLVAVLLERRRRAQSAAADGPLPAWLLRDERFRRAIGVNEHDGVEWFNKERWAQALERLSVPAVQRKRLSSVAAKAGYRLDALGAQLAGSVKRGGAVPRSVSGTTKSAGRSAAKSAGKSKSAARPSGKAKSK